MTLRNKLIGIYALVLAVVIGGFSVAMVVALRSTLEQGIAAEVEARARAIGAVVEFEGGAFVIEPKTGIAEQYGPGSGLYYVVRDASGNTLLASSTWRPKEASPRPGEYTRSVIAVAKTGDDDEPMQPTTLHVECGKDAREVESAVASLTRLLLWLGPSVLVVSLLGGFVLAGRALRPIEAIARTAAAITGRDLGRRIPVEGRDELARLASTLNLTFERLEDAFERERRFTADASHELRTPLAVIAGNVEVGLNRDRSTEDLRAFLREIGAASAQMQELIDGLLTLAREEHGTPRADRVDLAALCAEVAQSEDAVARSRRVRVRCEPAGTVVVSGNRAALHRLVSNLLRNAIRHGAENGEVVLRTEPAGTGARLTIQDDGPGISAEALTHLGERFFRVDPSRSRATGGIGLGLSIVRAIAHSHGGTLSFTSEVGSGTCVTVLLPGATDSAPESDAIRIARPAAKGETPRPTA